MEVIKTKNEERLLEIAIRLIADEFGITFDSSDAGVVERLSAAVRVYDDLEDFYVATGWDRDNPECADKEYLTKHGICRWIQGKVVYLSRIALEAESGKGVARHEW